MLRKLLSLVKLDTRLPFVAAVAGKVILGARGAVWRISPEQAEKLADDLVDMAELARVMEHGS